MSYLPIEPPPGLSRGGTEYQAGKPVVRWWDQSLTRWYDRMLGPVGGFRARSPSAVAGKARAMIAWSAAPATRWIGIGTHTGLYVQNSVGALFDITPAGLAPGAADEAVGTGFGLGPFGAGAFGTPRPDTSSSTPASVWDLDLWGGWLQACGGWDGTIWEWRGGTGSPALAVAGAPTGCAGIVTAEQGFLLAYGAGGDPRRIQWCDQGDNTSWTPSTANQAGDVALVTAGKIIKGLKLGPLVLILTDLDAHVGSYSGLPYVFSFERVGNGCGAIAKGCAVAIGQRAVWWSPSGFWLYDGAIQPLDCALWDFLSQDLNTGQKSKITGWHNAGHGEVWWHYPSRASAENDRYVWWDYRRNLWGRGELARLAGAEVSVFKYPLAMGDDGLCYEHEVGDDYGGATPFAETGPYELGDGGQAMRVGELVCDEAAPGRASISFRTRDRPNGDETAQTPVTLGADGRGFPRFTARQTRVRVEFAADPAARLGQMRLGVQPGGRR